MSQPQVRAAGLLVYRLLPSGMVEYLLMQHSYGEKHWTPPKGHVDPGEDELTTAKRETLEESGLDASKDLEVDSSFSLELKYFVTSARDGANRLKRVTYWPAKLINEEAKVVLSEEHCDFEWANLTRACGLMDKFDDMKLLMKRCNEHIKNIA